jgi:hypothetical protein
MNYQYPPTTLGDQLPGSSTDTKPPESGTDSPRSSHVLYSVIGAMGRWNSEAEEDPDLMPLSKCSVVLTNHRDRGGDRYSAIFPNPPSNLGIKNVTVVPEENVTDNFQWPDVPVTTTYTIDGDSPVGQIEVTPITEAAIPVDVLSIFSKAYPGRFEAWTLAEVKFVERAGIEQTLAQSDGGTKYQSSRGTKRGPEPEPSSPDKRGCY